MKKEKIILLKFAKRKRTRTTDGRHGATTPYMDPEIEKEFGLRINTQFKLSNEEGKNYIAEICEK